jgi:hypothetical protein
MGNLETILMGCHNCFFRVKSKIDPCSFEQNQINHWVFKSDKIKKDDRKGKAPVSTNDIPSGFEPTSKKDDSKAKRIKKHAQVAAVMF